MLRQVSLIVVLAVICHVAIKQSYANVAHDCYFVDGKALCGADGQLAREQDARSIRAKMLANQQKAEHGELPQGDDPRFESRASRVAFTGRADTNEKGNARPEKGQARPLSTPCTTTTTTTTTTPPPCPMTTTTTPPPCPLATTKAPLSPCELARMRQNNYVMHDQPIAEATMLEDTMLSDQPLPSFNAQITTEEPSTTMEAMMESRMPASHNRNRGRLSLYHTFMSTPGVYGHQNNNDAADNNNYAANNNYNDNDEDYGTYY